MYIYLSLQKKLRHNILKNLHTIDWSFDKMALQIYAYQREENPVYREYLTLTNQLNKKVMHRKEIPFLPIAFFKTHEVKTGHWQATKVFESSGTTDARPSRHWVNNQKWYLENAKHIFEAQFGSLTNFHILGLLPGYLERSTSSLVAMVQFFKEQSDSALSGFYLNDFKGLKDVLAQAKKTKKKVLLIGVSFGLLDFAEAYPNLDLAHCIIMETGGMKGRRKEMIRQDLHRQLQNAFNVPIIHSEYGMTELFSQAYAQGELFIPGKTMKIALREFNDPFAISSHGQTGLINIIDLANFDTCSFIATDDIGRVYQDGSFEVLGRYDHSDMRGCNLMISDL